MMSKGAPVKLFQAITPALDDQRGAVMQQSIKDGGAAERDGGPAAGCSPVDVVQVPLAMRIDQERRRFIGDEVLELLPKVLQ